MDFDPAYAWHVLPVILLAARTTIIATVAGMILALLVGLVFVAAGRSHWRAIRRVSGFVSLFLRGTPLLVHLYVLFYVLPEHGVHFSPMQAGLLGLGMQYGAYVGEVYRGGIEGVGRGQWDAAASLGLGRSATWVRVALPQIVPRILPLLGNYLIVMFKSTPYLAAITVNEMLGTALDEAGQSFRYLEPMLIVGAVFMVASYAAAALLHVLERATENRGQRDQGLHIIMS